MLNLVHKVKDVSTVSGSLAPVAATYLYAADGTKLRVKGRDGLNLNGFDYLGSVTLERGTGGSLNSTEAVFAGGQFKDGEVMYFDVDHLGSVRAVINNEGELLATNDYYPFGLRHNGGILNDNVRYKFNGMEEQIIGDLDLLDYNARMYDPIVARWFVHDKLAEKYFKISPYVYCANNPLKFIDPTGMEIEDRVFNAAVGSGIGSYDTMYQFGGYVGDEAGGSNAGSGDSPGPWTPPTTTQNNSDPGSELDNYVETNQDSGDSNSSEESSEGMSEAGAYALGVAAAAIDTAGDQAVNAGGTYRVTNGTANGNKLRPKHYKSGWKGGSRAGIKTHSMKSLGRGLKGLGAVGGAVGIYNSYGNFQNATTLEQRIEYGGEMFIGAMGLMPGGQITLLYPLHKQWANETLPVLMDLGVAHMPAVQPFK